MRQIKGVSPKEQLCTEIESNVICQTLQDAYDAANNVIALKLYGLTDKYEDAWKGNNKEAILEFDYDAANGLIIFSTDIMYHNVMVMTMVQQELLPRKW